MVVCFAGVSFHKRDRFKVRGVLTFHVAALILLRCMTTLFPHFLKENL